MSTTIGQYGDAGASLILSSGIKDMNLENETLSWETSAGTLSETYAGLGSTRSTAISLTPQITQVGAWQANITNAQTNLTVTATALTQLVSQAQSMATSLVGISGTTSPGAVTSVAAQAASTLTELQSVLNTSSGSGYVFSGNDSNTPPINGNMPLANSALAAQISSIVGTLGSAGASSVMADATTAASDPSLSVFSPSLSVSPGAAAGLQRSVVTGDNSSIAVGIVATQGTATSSASSTSTGSPIRDLMRDMMIMSSMKNMSPSTSGFSDLVNQLNASLTTTIGQLTDMESTVGVTQDGLTSQSTLLTSVQSMLTTQLSNARDADIASVATETSELNTRLEASYILVSDMKNMTLANYI
ncbi:flagellin [Nguyenibacter sp. L1]|uniref:flagellin n=1 Tax=Nguyenibacter sp. L1 TaxID=3049350 RepID=UPI002B4675E4|nr:flagellin [Nguyenibacter sp. L1]WRH89736.1 flagellin [Nguyenibacter sp. L1]